MVSLENLLLYIPMSAMFVMLPGPDFALIARVALLQGRARGQAAACGIALGICLHTAAAMLGISAIVAHSAFWFSVLQYLGAAWLVWLGIQALRAGRVRAAVVKTAPDADREEAGGGAGEPLTLRQWLDFFGQGLLTNALNPKAVLVFLTFLPQFTDPRAPLGPQFLVLGGILVGLCLAWFVPLAYMLGRVRRVFENSRFQQWLQRCTGIIFIAFGLKLATASR